MIVSRAWLLIVAIGCLVPGSSRGEWSLRYDARDGATRASSEREGSEPALVLRAQERWTVDEESSDIVFGDIEAVVRDRAGRTCLLDAQVSLIYVVSPSGEDIRTIGGAGEGPGEFLAASDMTLLSDSVLCVSQVMPPRLVKIAESGRAHGDYPLGKDLVTALINGCTAVDGSLELYLGQVTQDQSSIAFRTYFTRLDENGQPGAADWEMSQSADFANITFDEKADDPPVWAIGTDGRIFVNTDWDAYEIEVVDTAAGERQVIEREYEPLPRPRWQLALVDALVDKQEMPPSTSISETARTLVRIVPRANGVVWVLSGRGENDVPPGCMMVFDEFDSSGRYIREVRVRGKYQPGRDAFFMSGDFFYVVANGGPLGGADIFDDASLDTDTIQIRCYELRPPEN